jgi:hypothetical protein
VQQKLALLSAEQHRDLRMHSLAGEHPHCVQIVLNEFALAAAVCPIFMMKDPETGQFNVFALFGFAPKEILVEGADQANAAFLPLDMVRQGFFADGENIAVDLAHPRFAPDAKIALFDADGQPTDEMRLVQRAIGVLMQGRAATDEFVQQMMQLRLVEPIDIALRFDDGENRTLEGLYTISLDALNDLDDQKIVRLYRNGYLAAALTLQGSVKQVGVLARRRNAQIAAI